MYNLDQTSSLKYFTKVILQLIILLKFDLDEFCLDSLNLHI